MEISVLHRQGMSIRAIARRLSCSSYRAKSRKRSP
ncbi:helix-turn-helix domain-containing protein [Arsenophonus sp. ENCA]|nr:helix-turn-helix domain-containing protein [Arsenophonus sp. ENCA]